MKLAVGRSTDRLGVIGLALVCLALVDSIDSCTKSTQWTQYRIDRIHERVDQNARRRAFHSK